MKREYRFMSNRQKEEALRLYKSGLTYDEIGGRLDIDPSRVGQLARKEGLPPRASNRSMSPKQKAAAERWRLARERQKQFDPVSTTGEPNG